MQRLIRISAWTLAAITLAANLGDTLFPDYFGVFVMLPWSLGTFAGVGLVVTLRRPRHPIGWLFLVAGTLFALELVLSAYTWAGVTAGRPLPFVDLAMWLNSILWLPALGCVLIAATLFPTGRLPSKRWRLLLWPIVALFAIGFVALGLGDGPISLPTPMTEGPGVESPVVRNPMALPGALGAILAQLASVSAAAVPVAFLMTAASAIVRFRRADGVERAQLKWFASAAGLSLVLLSISFLPVRWEFLNVFWMLGVMSLGLLPVAVGLAILRYRLYDIDGLINRALVYGSLTASLAVLYVGSVVGSQALLGPLTGGNEVAVAASTLLAVALFQPFRRRLQRAVDRRFYRSRYDAERALDAFSARLRDEIDVDELRQEILAVVASTVEPRSAAIWLRERSK